MEPEIRTDVKAQNNEDYAGSMADLRALTESYLHEAMNLHDENRIRYLKGMLRGIEMAIELYLFCLEEEERNMKCKLLSNRTN